MPYYEWSETMSVGVPLIDSDHKALIRLINRLHDGLAGEDEAGVLAEVMDKLIAYVNLHFAREEKVMEACGYPELPGHRDEHARFTDRIREIKDRQAREPNASVTRKLLNHLKAWLNHHILIQDMAYRAYTEANSELADRVARSFGPGLADDDAADGVTAAPA